ncbi:class I SAM-dependent methyltransferase [Exilibacterium tricleocarpae]|uniref:Class I SAM-dependent methyltransferase n=1 Tax=Exilibacterium tricleocarpae TaxID=2591008 RepID=A0A545U482_9GAMM|nr:class I SAM-dependent methyltransferase [Exilibacterium tricleocarpae]TQV84280.1 class I SAM-dependent methyltransferase [Exilibacterium tricleocarpae]
MYELLFDFSRRPEPFSCYTAKALWTRPHLARQMLNFHLDQETDLASRKLETIDRVVSWIDEQLSLSGKHVCDLGCGPGLYTKRFASRGAVVTGVDFSTHSLEHAKSQTKKPIRYIHADYLSDDLPIGFDVLTLIYCDFCVLSSQQRKTLLSRMKEMLNPGGQIVIDVAGMGLFASKEELTIMEDRFMDGFWAAGDYVGIQRSFVYPEERLSLDRYLIVEPTETWQVFNWFQHFTPESIEAELSDAGFKLDQMVGELSGEPLNPKGNYIGIVASLI